MGPRGNFFEPSIFSFPYSLFLDWHHFQKTIQFKRSITHWIYQTFDLVGDRSPHWLDLSPFSKLSLFFIILNMLMSETNAVQVRLWVLLPHHLSKNSAPFCHAVHCCKVKNVVVKCNVSVMQYNFDTHVHCFLLRFGYGFISQHVFLESDSMYYVWLVCLSKKKHCIFFCHTTKQWKTQLLYVQHCIQCVVQYGRKE